MPMSSRAAGALGLGLLGVAALVVPASSADNDRKAAAGAWPTAAIASIDMDKVFKEYEKVKASSDQLKADALAKQGQFVKMNADLKKLGEQMQGFKPGSNDYKKAETEYTNLKAQFEAQRDQAQHEFARREAEALAALYTEVQDVVAAVAKANKMTYVVKVSNEPVTGSDPNSVMAAMARSVVYADPSKDITQYVITSLNQRFQKTAGAAKPATTGPAPSAAAPKAN